MRVLVVKLTSMGDVLHLMPALTDLQNEHPEVKVDWMVEESFAEIPSWHPSVDRVIPVATRRWRKVNRAVITEFLQFWRDLRHRRYDVILDAQGLMKSAVFARFAKLAKGGSRAGFSGASIKESPAARLYHKRIDVERKRHAITRLRELLAGVFEYPVPASAPEYKVQLKAKAKPSADADNSILLLHGTTWPSKHLPDRVWRELAELAGDDGYRVKVGWGNEPEKHRAQWIADGFTHVDVLPKTTLTDMALQLRDAAGAIAVDTGLAHMAAAFGVPCVSVYGPTDASLTGAVGANQVTLQSQFKCSPCLLKNCPKLTDKVVDPPCYLIDEAGASLRADALWQALYRQIV